MRKLMLGLLVPLAMAVSSGARADEGGVVVDTLLTEIQKTLVRVRDAVDDNDLPELHRVVLKLKSSLVEQAGGKLSLFVVTLGADVSRESVQEIEVVLSPPRPADESRVSAVGDNLAEAIIATVLAVKKAEDRTPPLRLSELKAAVRFVVKKEGEAGLDFQILPVTVGLGAGVNTTTTQEAILEFKG